MTVQREPIVVFYIVDSYLYSKNRKGTRCYISTATMGTGTRYSVTVYVRELPCFQSVSCDAGSYTVTWI